MLSLLEKINNQKENLKILILASDIGDITEFKKYFCKSDMSLIYNSKIELSSSITENIKLFQYERVDFFSLKLFLLYTKFDYIIDSTDEDEIEKIKMFNFLISKLNDNGIYIINNFYIDRVKTEDRDLNMEQFNEWALIKK